jgi:hypothetical protein
MREEVGTHSGTAFSLSVVFFDDFDLEGLLKI